MSIDKKITKYDKAHNDYNRGMKYKDIAQKYNVSENTVKTWKKRYGWKPRREPKKVSKVHPMGNNFDLIKEDLLNQLQENGICGEHYIDLINTYMELFNIKNELILDIEKRGVSVLWENGKQSGFKKNDSISELNKTIDRMLSILNDLGLKPTPNGGSGDDDEEL